MTCTGINVQGGIWVLYVSNVTNPIGEFFYHVRISQGGTSDCTTTTDDGGHVYGGLVTIEISTTCKLYKIQWLKKKSDDVPCIKSGHAGRESANNTISRVGKKNTKRGSDVKSQKISIAGNDFYCFSKELHQSSKRRRPRNMDDYGMFEHQKEVPSQPKMDLCANVREVSPSYFYPPVNATSNTILVYAGTTGHATRYGRGGGSYCGLKTRTSYQTVNIQSLKGGGAGAST